VYLKSLQHAGAAKVLVDQIAFLSITELEYIYITEDKFNPLLDAIKA